MAMRNIQQGKTVPQIGAILLGATYLFIGIIGFFATGFGGLVVDDQRALFGIFELNPVHNLVHIGIGLFLLVAASLKDPLVAKGTLLGVGIFYLLAAALGFTDNLEIVSMNGVITADNFLHLLSGLFGVAFGLAPSKAPQPAQAQAAPQVGT